MKEDTEEIKNLEKDQAWELAINEAKSLYGKRNNCQMLIAAKAIDVCEIVKGGSNRSLYSLKRFAQETNINYKTLTGWIFIYKSIYLKLPYKKRNEVKFINMLNVGRNIKKDTTKEEIIRLIDYEVNKGNIDSKLLNYTKYFRAVTKLLESKTIFDAKTESLEECFYWVSVCKVAFNRINKIKKIKAKSHNLLKTFNVSVSIKKALENEEIDYVKNEIGFTKLNNNDRKIYNYLMTNKSKRFTPTQLDMFGGHSLMSRKLKAIRSLNKLVDLELIKKTEKGEYFIK